MNPDFRLIAFPGAEKDDHLLPEGVEFDGRPIDRQQPLFWHYYGGFDNRQVALRDGDWKLVAGWDGPADMPTGGSLRPGVVQALKRSRLAHFELYHLQSDVGEHHNLADDYPERLRQMSETAQRLYEEVLSEGPEWAFE